MAILRYYTAQVQDEVTGPRPPNCMQLGAGLIPDGRVIVVPLKERLFDPRVTLTERRKDGLKLDLPWSGV